MERPLHSSVKPAVYFWKGKMRLHIIAPTKYLSRLCITGNQMAIAPYVLWQPREYRSFYRARREAGDYTILDNGAYELDYALYQKELLRALELIGGADLLVLPDCPGDSYECYRLWRRVVKSGFMARALDKYSNIKFLVPVQPMRGDRWLLRLLGEIERVDSITHLGIPPLYEGASNGGRLESVEYIQSIVGTARFKFHLLGLYPYDIPRQLNYSRVNKAVVGVDSSAIVSMLLQCGRILKSKPRQSVSISTRLYRSPVTIHHYNMKIRELQEYLDTDVLFTDRDGELAIFS